MKIKTIKVTNILAYHEPTEFEFDQNPVYIIGPNGSGKSSIIDIISTALYRKPVRTSSLTNILSNPEETGYVSIEFEFSGDTYKVERYIGKKGSGKHDKLYKNGELLIQGTQNVTKMIEDLIGPQSSWVSLVPQRQLTSVLSNNTFKELYYQAFQMNKINIFIKATNKLINKREYEIRAKYEEIENLEKEIASIKIDESVIQSLESEIKQIYENIQKLSKRDLSKQLVELSKKSLALKQEINTLKSIKSIQDHTKQYRYLLSLDIDETKLQTTHFYRNKAEAVKNWFLVDHNKLSKLKETLSEEASFLQEFKEISEKYLQSLKLQKLYEEFHSYSLQNLLKPQQTFPIDDSTIKQYALEIVGYLNKIYNLGLDVGSPDTITDDHFEMIKKHIRYLRTKTDCPSISNEDKQMLSVFSDWNEVQHYIQSIQSSFNELKSKLNYRMVYASKVLHKLNSIDFVDCEGIYSSYEEYEQYKKILQDITEISKYVSSFSEWKQIMQTEVDDHEILQLGKQLTKIRKDIELLEDELTNQQKQLDALHMKYQKLNDELQENKVKYQYKQTLEKRLKTLKKQLDRLVKSKIRYEKIHHIYETLKELINQRFKQTLPALVRSTIEKFGFDFTIEIDDDFSLKVYKDGNILTPQMLSGAQQSVLALAIRYNIAKLLNSSLPFILDEVTEGFDFNRIDLLKGFINQLAQTHQVIAISHDDRIVSDSIGQIIQLNVGG